MGHHCLVQWPVAERNGPGCHIIFYIPMNKKVNDYYLQTMINKKSI